MVTWDDLSASRAGLTAGLHRYSGSGIFRHTTLSLLPELHMPLWALSVQTPHIDSHTGIVQVSVTLQSASTPRSGKLSVAIRDKNYKTVGSMSVDVVDVPTAGRTVAANITVSNPKLWSPDSPTLYTVSASVVPTLPRQEWEDPAQLESTMGFRTISFSAEGGFKLNGVETKLYGGCLHHDNGPLGSKAIALLLSAL